MGCNISTLHVRREQLCRTFLKNKVVSRPSPLSDLVEIAADPGYDLRAGRKLECWTNMLASFEQAFKLQQRDANTKESKDTVLEPDDFPLRRSPLLFDNNL